MADGEANPPAAMTESVTVVSAEHINGSSHHGLEPLKQLEVDGNAIANDASPLSPRVDVPLPFGRNQTEAFTLDDYFVGFLLQRVCQHCSAS
jgi:hypothetical protein